MIPGGRGWGDQSVMDLLIAGWAESEVAESRKI